MQTLILIISEFAATAHLMMSLVLFYFSRRSVSYLSIAWIMLLVSLVFWGAMAYIATADAIPNFGMLHPILLIYLVASSYLQSIYPLGLAMPGYLQWGRMVSYAAPALIFIFIYTIGGLAGGGFSRVYAFEDIRTNLLNGDVLLRITALILSGYYIINMFRLPHRLVKSLQLPATVKFYGTTFGLVSVFFVAITIRFNFVALNCYMLLFTLLNMFLFFQTLKPAIQSFTYPDIRPVEEPPTPEAINKSERDDFNEANLHRFEVIEYVMQKEKPYLDCLFNREKLCRMAGFNRHLLLQSLRSQGYNDIHEYISRYRVAELKRLILAGEITDLKQHEKVGFQTLKTAVNNFERYENASLPQWFKENRPKPAGKRKGAAGKAEPSENEQAGNADEQAVHRSE